MIKEASTYSFEEGEILLFDKPYGWSSFQLVRKVRNILRVHLGKEVKVGHAGTLDPLATGLMVICTGKATRKAMGLTADDKYYRAGIQLGFTTDSYDLETEPKPYPDRTPKPIKRATIELVLNNMLGEQEQTPPVFSAKKIEGKRAYSMARKGEEVQMRKQLVRFNDFKIIEYQEENEKLILEIHCSKGTYIRSLAHDLGEKLGCGAYLASLVRTGSGPYRLSDAMDIQAFQQALPKFESSKNQDQSAPQRGDQPEK